MRIELLCLVPAESASLPCTFACSSCRHCSRSTRTRHTRTQSDLFGVPTPVRSPPAVCLCARASRTVRYVQDVFITKYDPTIEDSYRKPIDLGDEIRMLEILDTAGTDQFRSMRDLYMKNSHGFMLVYSVVAESTFLEVSDIYEQVLRVKDVDSAPVVLIGNKRDLYDQRAITTQAGEALASRWKAPFFETSAFDSHNIAESFRACVELIRAQDRKTAGGKKKQTAGKHSKCSIL